MAGSIASIEKLSGDNYGTWCVQVKSLLITLDLWNTIVEDCPENDPAKAIWLNNDKKALATITLCVKPSELIHIKNLLTAKGAWSTLSTIYKASTASRKVQLFKKLVRFKFKIHEKFAPQINDFCSTVDELKEIGIHLNKDLLTVLLLCCLPDEMENFVVAIECRDTLPAYENLISKILEEEMRLGEKNNSHGAENIFAANSKFDQKNNKRYTNNYDRNKPRKNNHSNDTKGNDGKVYNNNIKCFRCGRRGHIRSQCKVNDKRDIDFVSYLFEGDINLRESWILDSGATSHMSRRKEYFHSLRDTKQSIVLASGEMIYAEGVGDIKLKTQTATLTLHNVWYVPQLHSNFISITKVIKAGHSVIFERGQAIIKSKQSQRILTATLRGDMFIANLIKI